MPLTKCDDCGHDVSTRVSACPACGGPMDNASSVQASNSAGNKGKDGSYVTTQMTAKSLKLQQVAAILLLIFGLSMVFTSPEGNSPAIGGLCTLGGLVWLIGVRIATWWRHG